MPQLLQREEGMKADLAWDGYNRTDSVGQYNPHIRESNTLVHG